MPTTAIRNLRLLLLAAITITGMATASVYFSKRRVATQAKPKPLVLLPEDQDRNAQGFAMSRTDPDTGKTIFKATAKKAVDFRKTGRSQLEDVEIIIFGKSGDRHDRIVSKACEYDANTGRFFSEGEVSIH